MVSFYITEDVQPDGLAVLAASGEIDFQASPQLRECIDGHLKAGRRRLILDLSQVRFIDSTAIGVLAGCATKLREDQDGSLVLVCPKENPKVLRIFEIAGLESLVALRHSREEALSALTTAC